MSEPLKIALAGNPNSGKSSLFNALTGMRQKVGNFPGVTVDRKTGKISLKNKGTATLIDLPGLYSLYPNSEDELISARILTDAKHPDAPDVVVVVADATNLKRSLLLCTQIMDLRVPVILALNMSDMLQAEGVRIDEAKMSKMLGIPVVSISALKQIGLKNLKKLIAEGTEPVAQPFFTIPPHFHPAIETLKNSLDIQSDYHAFQVLLNPETYHPEAAESVLELQDKYKIKGAKELISNEIAVRYDRIAGILDATTQPFSGKAHRLTDQLDKFLLHPVFGYVIFVGILFLIFQALFAWSTYPMEWIDRGFTATGEWMGKVLPEHFLSELWVDGIWAGLGGIVIFVPQIAFLFMFIAILEGSGYMSRVVFLMDRIMRPFGFGGKSVIPLIGGMACAVPSIMMARSISNKTERLITIMVVPLMSCSARIPVYVLLISMFVPDQMVLGIFNLQGIVMTGMYFLGFFMALAVAWILKKIFKYAANSIFVTELPVYRTPPWKAVLLTMWHKSKTFVWEAGKVIMVISIILWGLASYGPGEEMKEIETDFTARIDATPEQADSLTVAMESAMLQASYAGKIGKFIEPVIRPMGFDWKIGIALITSFAAREVFVGTMATIYSAGEEAAEDQEGRFETLRARMFAEVDPDTGKPVYTLAVGVALLLFYAFAMQCMSTLAIVKRETGSWKMTFFMLAYMTGLAYASAFAAYQLLA